jgi:DNA primase
VLLCYDGDKAGRAAAYKASVLLSTHEVDGGVVLFDDGIDPADMVKDGKIEELISIMKRPIDLIEFSLQETITKYNTQNPYEKNQALKECTDFLKSLNPIIAEEKKEYLAKLLNIASHHITLGQMRIQPAPSVQSNNSMSKAEEKFFKTLIEKPD